VRDHGIKREHKPKEVIRMKWFTKGEKGFSLAELLIVIAIMGILATVAIMNMKGSETTAREAKLRANSAVLREALIAYHSDHGFFPCTANDYNHAGNQTNFKRQLTWFTREDGAPSQTKDDNYRYGPYLQTFPENPFYTGTNPAVATNVVINTTDERTMDKLQSDVAALDGNYGWYYEAKSGNVVANLGGDSFPDKYCQY